MISEMSSTTSPWVRPLILMQILNEVVMLAFEHNSSILFISGIQSCASAAIWWIMARPTNSILKSDLTKTLLLQQLRFFW
jgi:hypothetical protein